MTIDKFIVVLAGFIGIVFTYWFFLMKKDRIVKAVKSIDILVEGGYSPDTISIPKGKSTTINFLRKDENQCLEETVISDFKIKKFLPLNKKISITITPKKSGVYNFSCGMQMFHGKIIVE